MGKSRDRKTNAKRGKGRIPSLREPKDRQQFLKAVREVISFAQAAARCGVSKSAMRAEFSADSEFHEEARMTQRKALADGAKCVVTASKKDPKWALEMLERLDYATWGRRSPKGEGAYSMKDLVRFGSMLGLEMAREFAPELHARMREIIDRCLESMLLGTNGKR